MSDKIDYGQEIIEEPDADGSTNITTYGYYGGLNSVKIQKRHDLKTTHTTVAADVLRCLEALKAGSPELTIHITTDRLGLPNIIQKTWLVEKKKIK